MARFRKKPIEIEAWQVPVQYPGGEEAPAWVFEHKAALAGLKNGILIKTLEGEMLARPGDWIIKGVKGELYPCKPDIFAATYEPV